MSGGKTIASLVAALALLAPSAAAADGPYPPGPFAPWDGSNPFNCENQDVGTGTAFPDPGADPFCVEYDKTQQNITDLGILEFAIQEPTRLAAAADKCFYYQRDHWTGSIVQGEAPELWHWDGSYLIDRGSGVFGGNIENFRLFGQSAAPGDYFPIPPEYTEYFDQGGIGAYLVLNIPVDPRCAERIDTPEERAQVYGPGESSPLANPASGAVAGTGARGVVRKAKRCKHRRSRAARKRCRAKHR